ncbi:hypothetical protein TD95_004306 [Thielaviopsis punctulata]|uniref:Lignostilbene dioxygenase n=1 Tax=Thielaviopsis punctulata TaxID=72032 RepID=A0A0F4ZAK2_9PEZI|nr:hypothetical protein TD95_004306 [Thielaviopsis punctulata]
MAGHFRSSAFANLPQFSGFMKPCRFEGQLNYLEIEGDLPTELDGTFFRVMPDPQFVPFIKNDPWFNGDGNVSSFRFKDGAVHFKQRYVRTEKFIREREAGRALAGSYRNKYTDAVAFKVRTSANTNVVYFNKKLLAIKEDAPPFAMDPETLETLGLCDFDGQLPSATFTAHPKIDAKTGDLVGFGYEAKGDGTKDVCYWNIDKNGKFTEIVWLVAPVCGLIHDFAVTENWVLFPIVPQLCDIDRLKAGGEHWQWDSTVPFYLGVIPRHGSTGDDVKWFRAPNAFPGHTTNAYENADGHVVLDIPLTDRNVFFWWPDANGNAPDPTTIHAKYVRITVDPHATDLELPPATVIKDIDMEFPRIDERVSMDPHRYSFFSMMQPSLGTDFARLMPVAGGGYPLYNSWGFLDHETKDLQVYYPGPMHMVQESVFVPRNQDAPEADGFLMGLVNNYETQSSEIHVIDTKDFSKARAVVKINMRLRQGLHGNWVDAKDME